MKPNAGIVACSAIFAMAMAGRLLADTPPSSYQLASNAQVIEFLLQSVNWYRHAYAERQVASDATDLLFLDDNQAIEKQIVQLSFEFAKADAELVATGSSLHSTPSSAPAAPPPSDLAHFIQLNNRSDRVSQQTIQQIDILKQKLDAARTAADREKLKAALDDAQSRLELLHAVSQTVNDLIGFVQAVGTGQAQVGNLQSTIDDLARSVPEINSPSTFPAKLPQDASSRTMDSWRETGLLGMMSEISAVKRKLQVVDEKMRLTDDLALRSESLRSPMAGFITRLLESAGTSDLQTSDLSLLRQTKSHLDALRLDLQGFSRVIVALDKQKVLLAEYQSHLVFWRTAVADQRGHAWKKLVMSLLVIVLIIGLLIGVGEISRKLALRRIQDPNRQRAIGMVQRFLTFFAITILILFSLALDLSSLATYFGLLAAGVAVALQNVILASLGYLLLVGKRGIRIGDRVRVSGLTGDVVNMGLLQFQLREFDVEKKRFTGHVATFSNSLVFVSPAIGLLKFGSAPAEDDA